MSIAIAWIIYKDSSTTNSNSGSGTQNNNTGSGTQLVNPVVVHPDPIPGTRFSFKRVGDDMFPFGYAMWSLQGDEWTFTSRPLGFLTWDISKRQITITPNYANKTVTWDIAQIDATLGTNRLGQVAPPLRFMNLDSHFSVPTLEGMLYKVIPIQVTGEPMPFVTTLSPDPRNLVFALGFRIPNYPNEESVLVPPDLR